MDGVECRQPATDEEQRLDAPPERSGRQPRIQRQNKMRVTIIALESLRGVGIDVDAAPELSRRGSGSVGAVKPDTGTMDGLDWIPGDRTSPEAVANPR